MAKAVAILAKYFNQGEAKKPLTEFTQELKKLSPEEKHELASLAGKELGLPCDDCA